MEYQLRIYDITPGALDEFSDLMAEVFRLRREMGFEVAGAWIDRQANRYVWIVGYDGDLEAATAAYAASPERAGMQPDPGASIEHIETSMLVRAPHG